MLEKIFWAAVGALIMRYVILHTTDYKKKEAELFDDARNKAHDLIKKYAPEADDSQVANDVLTAFPES